MYRSFQIPINLNDNGIRVERSHGVMDQKRFLINGLGGEAVRSMCIGHMGRAVS
jgi:hypothetical protein